MSKEEVNMEDLIGKVYFQIATWHNDTPDFNEVENKTRLYGASFDVIKTVLEAVGLNLVEEKVEGAKKTEEDKKMDDVQSKLSDIASKLKSQGLI